GAAVAEGEGPLLLRALQAAQRQFATNTLLRPKPREWTVCDADTKIPKRDAIYLEFLDHSISLAGSTRSRSSRTRNMWRCSTKPCMTFASFPRTTAGIHGTTGPGMETHAAAGKAKR